MAKNVLIVDDSVTIRKLVSFTLKFRGYDIATANNGKEAWDLLQKIRFNILIIDILMPVMDGFELLKKIKNDKKIKNIPCVILTTEGDKKIEKKGNELGADSFLVKPFQPKQLVSKVEEFIK